MLEFIHLHPTITAIIGYYVFSAIVGGMPTPVPGSSSAAYTWMYNSLHLLAGNITEAFKKKFPAMAEGSTFKEQTTTTISSPGASNTTEVPKP